MPSSSSRRSGEPARRCNLFCMPKEPNPKLDELNSQVTEAIFRAEHHDSEGAMLWDKVARLEQQIALHTPVDDLEHEIALRGILSAQERADFLRRKPPQEDRQEGGGAGPGPEGEPPRESPSNASLTPSMTHVGETDTPSGPRAS